jgi:hypothetical protein
VSDAGSESCIDANINTGPDYLDECPCLDDGTLLFQYDSVLLTSQMSSSAVSSIDHDYDTANDMLSKCCDWFVPSAAPIYFVYPEISDTMVNTVLPVAPSWLPPPSVSWPPAQGALDEHYIQLHATVFASRMPNYLGCRLPVPSSLNITAWRYGLDDYHDKVVADFLEYGWPVNYVKDTLPRPSPRNHRSALLYPYAVDQYVSHEIGLGAILGPFDNNPLSVAVTVSPLSTVFKSDTSRRVIVDESFGGEHSVNAGISSNAFLGEYLKLRYPKHDDFIDIINAAGPSCLLWKCDLSRAFRQLPVDPHDFHLLGYSWRDRLFIDCRLIFGLRSAPQACQRTTNAIAHMYCKSGNRVVNYVDDFAGAAIPCEAQAAYQHLLYLLRSLGVDYSLSKCVAPSTTMVFLGKLYNTVDMTISIPPGKLQETLELLRKFVLRKKCTKRQLQQLIGKLAFIAECVRSGRLFIRRILAVLRSYSHNNHRIYLNRECKQDFHWWLTFLQDYNGISIIPDTLWSEPDVVLATDSCLDGLGGIDMKHKRLFHTRVPVYIQQQFSHISALEMYAIYIALRLWAYDLVGARIQLHCDNLATVYVLNSGSGRDACMLNIARQLWMLCARHSIQIRCVHLPGTDNRVADACSRYHMGTPFTDIVQSYLNMGYVDTEVLDDMFSMLYSV